MEGYNPYTNGSGNLTETNNRSAAAASSRIRKSIPYGPGYETRLRDAYLRAFHKDIQDSSNGRIAKLVLNKIALLWTFDWTDRGVVVRPDYLIPWLVTNLLALIGLVATWRWRRWIGRGPTLIYATTLTLLTFAYATTSVHARYRMQIEPFIFILAGLGCVGIVLRFRGYIRSFRVSTSKSPPGSSSNPEDETDDSSRPGR